MLQHQSTPVNLVPIEKVKKGDLFRKPGQKAVRVADGYCRYSRKYSAYRWDDINAWSYLKKGTLVEVDFYF